MFCIKYLWKVVREYGHGDDYRAVVEYVCQRIFMWLWSVVFMVVSGRRM